MIHPLNLHSSAPVIFRFPSDTHSPRHFDIIRVFHPEIKRDVATHANANNILSSWLTPSSFNRWGGLRRQWGRAKCWEKLNAYVMVSLVLWDGMKRDVVQRKSTCSGSYIWCEVGELLLTRWVKRLEAESAALGWQSWARYIVVSKSFRFGGERNSQACSEG